MGLIDPLPPVTTGSLRESQIGSNVLMGQTA